MDNRWSETLANPAEQAAFFHLLDDYFSRGSQAPPSAPAPRVPAYHQPSRPSFDAPPPAPAPSTSSPSNFNTSVSKAVLDNPAISGAALQRAGLSKGASATLSKFGAKHSETLAPHLANATQAGVKRGVAAPSGLQTVGGKSFGKAIFTSKGPMSKEEANKDKYTGSLATRMPVKTGGAGSHVAPPPKRAVASEGLGSAQALYDYAGTDANDLGVHENETVTVVEHVSDDWWKCRNAAGEEGLVPANYLQAL
ncbi:hypothetical protein MNV49_002705 [Pseudohyphozyma bogoriensis]|nr:hypothetical protein MNV49_002705 [Pseudohyphozyma bogoriensis]